MMENKKNTKNDFSGNGNKKMKKLNELFENEKYCNFIGLRLNNQSTPYGDFVTYDFCEWLDFIRMITMDKNNGGMNEYNYFVRLTYNFIRSTHIRDLFDFRLIREYSSDDTYLMLNEKTNEYLFFNCDWCFCDCEWKIEKIVNYIENKNV